MFITLNRYVYNYEQEFQQIQINSDFMVSFESICEQYGGLKTKVKMASGDIFYVLETPFEIDKKINEKNSKKMILKG